MIKRIFNLVADRTACALYRAVLPAKYLTPRLAAEGIELITSEQFDFETHYDAIIFHRAIQPSFLPYFLRLREREGVKLVMDIDDLLTNIPSGNPARNVFRGDVVETMRFAFDRVDTIITSTEPLRQYLGYSAKTVVLENLIENNPTAGQFVNVQPGRILYAGSNTHVEDVALVTEPLKSVIERDDVQDVIFIGQMPDDEQLIGHPKFTFIPLVNLDMYPKLLKALRPQIALLPLQDHPFNESKSKIKYFEMTQAGAFCIASPVGPYEDLEFVQHARTEDEWVERITSYLQYTDGTSYIHDYLQAQFSFHDQNPRATAWLDFFRGLVQESQ